MIVLDTNVASEVISPTPNPGVLAWVDSLDADEVVITAPTAAEMRFGAALLPHGRRRAVLQEDVEDLLDVVFAGRVLPFDVDCTGLYAQLRSDRHAAGRPMSISDAQIAAICLHYGATLATRNVKDFVGVGLEIIDPWNEPG
jgi:predicted nucleic acid-binding protein